MTSISSSCTRIFSTGKVNSGAVNYRLILWLWAHWRKLTFSGVGKVEIKRRVVFPADWFSLDNNGKLIREKKIIYMKFLNA